MATGGCIEAAAQGPTVLEPAADLARLVAARRRRLAARFLALMVVGLGVGLWFMTRSASAQTLPVASPVVPTVVAVVQPLEVATSQVSRGVTEVSPVAAVAQAALPAQDLAVAVVSSAVQVSASAAADLAAPVIATVTPAVAQLAAPVASIVAQLPTGAVLATPVMQPVPASASPTTGTPGATVHPVGTEAVPTNVTVAPVRQAARQLGRRPGESHILVRSSVTVSDSSGRSSQGSAIASGAPAQPSRLPTPSTPLPTPLPATSAPTGTEAAVSGGHQQGSSINGDLLSGVSSARLAVTALAAYRPVFWAAPGQRPGIAPD
jgi:hypothetical protein